MSNSTWLTHLDEQIIKAQFNKLIEESQIDSDITQFLQELNKIDGLVTLFSCQGKGGTNSYLVLKTNENMAFLLQEGIWHTKELHPNMEIVWDGSVYYNVIHKHKEFDCIILSDKTSYKFIESLTNYFL